MGKVLLVAVVLIAITIGIFQLDIPYNSPLAKITVSALIGVWIAFFIWWGKVK